MNTLEDFDKNLQLEWLNIGMKRTKKKGEKKQPVSSVLKKIPPSIPNHGLMASKRNWRDLNDMVRSRMILKGSQCSDFSPLHTLLENAFMPNIFDRKRIYKIDATLWHWRRFAARSRTNIQEVYGVRDLVDTVMIFLDGALMGSHDLMVIKVGYHYMLTDNTTAAGHSMLLIGGLTSKVGVSRTTPMPIHRAPLWLQIFDPNGTYPTDNIQASATPLEWLPWFFHYLNQEIIKTYPRTNTMESDTSYWAFTATSLHRRHTDDWTVTFLEAFMDETTTIYPNRIDINNMDYLTAELKTLKDAIHQRQTDGHLNLLDETGFPDLPTLITSISYTGICGHITLLLRLLIYAVPRENRTDGQIVMAIALKALTSSEDSTLTKEEKKQEKKKKTAADWKKIMAMISWSIWGKIEANSGNTLVNLIKTSFPSKDKRKKAVIDRTYTQATPDSIIALLQPRGILDPSHISFDTARFFMHRMGIQLKNPGDTRDGPARKAIHNIAWVAHNAYIMYRLTNVFDPRTVTAIVNLTGKNLDTLVASHENISHLLLSPSSSLNPTTMITLAVRSLGHAMLKTVGYDIHGRPSKIINMALSSLSDFLSRSSTSDLLSRRFGFYVQKVDNYRIQVLKLDPLFHNEAMTKMTATDLRNSLLAFSKSLFQPLTIPRYFSQPTGKTNSRIQIRWEALFKQLNDHTQDTYAIKRNLKRIQLESLLLWVYTMKHQPIASIVTNSIMKTGLLVFKIPNAMLDRREIVTKTTADLFSSLQTALIPPPPASVPTFTDYFSEWRLYSAPILKISTVGRILTQNHVHMAKVSGMVFLGSDADKNPFSSPPIGKPGSLFTFLKQFHMPSLSMLHNFLDITNEKKEN